MEQVEPGGFSLECNSGKWRMAQWLGQFTGLTRATKVADAENALRVAAAALRAAGPDEASAKARAVRRLAQRLLAVRLKAIKAQRIAATPADRPSAQADRLRRQEDAVKSAGVSGIFAEFEVRDAAD
jgi:hypothetical protein